MTGAKQASESAQADSDGGTGQPSYCGYEYQILATVWAGLELTTKGRAEAIIVEPPSDEDVAVDLNVPPENASSHIEVGTTIQIQFKLRNNTVWHSRNFNALLSGRLQKGTRGPIPRTRPLEYLSRDKSCRYVLVTNADVQRKLRNFVVTGFEEQSCAVRIPCRTADNPGVARRIAILPNMNQDLLDLRIRGILQQHCHVPGPQLDDCITSLEHRVRDRLLGERANRFPWHEMQQVIRDHAGSVKQPCEPIPPSNFGRIKEQLFEKHALLLVGPPGTGKTTLANALMAEIETGSPPAQRVTVCEPAGIEAVRCSLSDQHDHVYYFEDPWGQDVPGLGASFFTSQLPKLMREAGQGKRFVVTSRLGVFQQAVGTRQRLFQPYRQELHPKHYKVSDYRELYDRQVADWPKQHRKLARTYRTEVLKLLETPYSVVIFCQALFDRIETGKRVYNSDVEKIAKHSNVDSFGAVLKDRIIAGGSQYVSSAVAIWAQLIVGADTIKGTDVKGLRSLLRAGGLEDPPDVLKLFNDLADARWFQSRADSYVTTPSVRDALAQFEMDEPATFQDTIGALIRGWAEAGSFDAVLACVKASGAKQEILPEKATGPFDSYLVSRVLQKDGYQFNYAYSEIAQFSRSAHPVAVLARGLSRRDKPPLGHLRSFGAREPKWTRPTLSESEIAVISESAECAQFAKRFVTDYIPHEVGMRLFGNTYDPVELLDFLGQFGWPICEWFRTGFTGSVRYPDESTGFLAECLCTLDKGSVDTVLEACLTAFQRVFSRATEDTEEHRRHAQGEVDALPDGACEGDIDRYHQAEYALRIAVNIKRKGDGYTWIPQHASVIDLLQPWSEILKHNGTPDEREALVACCDHHRIPEPAYAVIREHPDAKSLAWILRQLFSQQSEIPWGLADAVEKYASTPEFFRVLEQERARYTLEQRALVGFFIIVQCPAIMTPAKRGAKSRQLRRSEEQANCWRPILERLLTDDERRLVAECHAMSQIHGGVPSGDVHDRNTEQIAALVDRWPDVPAVYALEALARANQSVESRLDRFLKSANETARSHALTFCRDRQYLLLQGLRDADWNCRVAAMESLAEAATAEERDKLFGLANDKSAYVRKAVALCIGEHQWPDGIPVLIHLLRDHREFGEQHTNDDFRIFEVARAACNSLRVIDPLPDDAITSIQSFLGECEGASYDITVHGLLFRILGEHPDEETFRFCALYFDETWMQSKWNEHGGHDLIVECLHVIAKLLLKCPEWSKHLNLKSVAEVAAWEDDDAWLVGPGLIVLGLAEDPWPGHITRITVQKSFGEQRARILFALCKTLRENKPMEILGHIPTKHPFMKLCLWADDNPKNISWEDLLQENPGVATWVQSLGKGKFLVAYERWAVCRLIGKDARLEMSGNLPHRFLFENEKE